MIDSHHGWNTNVKPLAIGLILSFLCLFLATWLAPSFLVPILGFFQILIQMVCFYHIGAESKPRWNLWMFLFMALVVFLIIGGSLWIMNNLNRYTMINA